jgi:hypothetical protein
MQITRRCSIQRTERPGRQARLLLRCRRRNRHTPVVVCDRTDCGCDLIWAHKADDPRNYVGDVVSATETDEGLEVTGRLDLGTEHGAAAYRNIKGRRVSGCRSVT